MGSAGGWRRRHTTEPDNWAFIGWRLWPEGRSSLAVGHYHILVPHPHSERDRWATRAHYPQEDRVIIRVGETAEFVPGACISIDGKCGRKWPSYRQRLIHIGRFWSPPSVGASAE